MAEETQWTKDNRPPRGRGKSFKSKLLDAIQRDSLLDAEEGEDPAKTEERFISHMAERAFDASDNASATLLKELLSKSYSSLKQTLPTLEFEFDAKSSPSQQVMQLMEAASKGEIAPDIAVTFVNAVKAAVEIEQATDLKTRIEQLEKLLDGAGQ